MRLSTPTETLTPTPSKSGLAATAYAGGKFWRSAELARIFNALFPDVSAFAPSPEQWELDLGDLLPLQTRPARSERSERGRSAFEAQRD